MCISLLGTWYVFGILTLHFFLRSNFSNMIKKKKKKKSKIQQTILSSLSLPSISIIIIFLQQISFSLYLSFPISFSPTFPSLSSLFLFYLHLPPSPSLSPPSVFVRSRLALLATCASFLSFQIGRWIRDEAIVELVNYLSRSCSPDKTCLLGEANMISTVQMIWLIF